MKGKIIQGIADGYLAIVMRANCEYRDLDKDKNVTGERGEDLLNHIGIMSAKLVQLIIDHKMSIVANADTK